MRPFLWAAMTACATQAEVVDMGLDTAGPQVDEAPGLDGSWGIWIEVEPADETVAGRTVLPQRFGPFASGEAFELALRPAARVQGTLTGSLTTPWSLLPLPTREVPVPATVTFLHVTSRLASQTRSSADGSFQTDLTAGFYTIDVVPDDPGLAPQSTSFGVATDQRLDLDLDPGVSVWGRVRDADGSPLPSARVSLVSPAGLETTAALTDDAGWYEVHGRPGEWSLRVASPQSGREPVLRSSLPPLEEAGARVDVSFERINRADLAVRLIDRSGEPVRGLTVVLTATRIDRYEAEEASFSLQTSTNGVGTVTERVPAGTYDIAVLPDGDEPFAARTLRDVRLSGDVDLGDLVLEGFADVTIDVMDDLGSLVAGATARCNEREGAGRAWTGEADELGVLRLRLPRAPVRCFLLPPDDRSDLASRRVDLEDPTQTSSVTLGAGVALAGRAVMEDDGSPAELAIVRVLDESFDLLGFGLTDTEGGFQLRIPTEEQASP